MRSTTGRCNRWVCDLLSSLLTLWLCFGPVAGAPAGEMTVLQDVVLRNWDLDDGLPSARINAITRTSDGFLWLATQKGLVRFDGTHFVVFAQNPWPSPNKTSTIYC